MNRGVRHGAIFNSDHHCIRFLELLEAAVERFGIRLVAYVLMGNHYHLLLESVRGNLSAAMKMISQEYTQFVNQSPGWEGPVFRGRFKSKLVIDDGHWHHLPMYMHLNPVRARMVTHASQYTWSSQTAYSGETIPPAWLDTGDVMDGYGGPAGYNELLEEVVQGRQPAPEEFSQVLFERTGRAQNFKFQPVKPEAFRTPTAAIDEVAELVGVSVRELKQPVRGRGGNPARALALWWLVFGAELGSGAAGRHLGMSPNAASKTLAKWKQQGPGFKSEQLWIWRQELENRKKEQ